MPDTLLSQTEARQEARKLNETPLASGLVHVAAPFPFGSWGGEEKGWTVITVDGNRFV